MKYWKRILAMIIVASILLSTTIISVASGKKGTTEGLAVEDIIYDPSKDGDGFSSYAWRVGLAQCNKEVYPNEDPTNTAALYNWVITYNAKYYTPIEGTYILVDEACNEKEVISKATGIAGATEDKNGRQVVKEAYVDKVMEKLQSCNPALYSTWLEQSHATGPYNPIVISVEPVVKLSNGVAMTVAEYATNWCGVTKDELMQDLSVYAIPAELQGKSNVSAVAALIMQKSGWMSSIQTDSNLIFRIFKGYFGWTYGKTRSGVGYKTEASGHGYHNVAHFAIGSEQVFSRLNVEGNYIVSVGSAGVGDDLYGKYTWHIKDRHLPDKNGFQEDGSVSLERSEAEQIPAVGFGFKQDNVSDWLWALDGASSITAEITYSYGWDAYADGESEDASTGGCGYSNDRSVLLGSSLTKKVTTTFSAEELKKSVKDGSVITSIDNLLVTDNVPSGSFSSFSFSSATKCTLKFDGYDISAKPSKTMKSGGYEVTLSNSQVHYAIHGTDDEQRTYKLIQEVADPVAQIRDEAVEGTTANEADYEASAGIPTTSDLMITTGGDTWVVNMQYRYCVDDYIRTYALDTVDAPNYMWYGLNTTGGNSFSTPQHTNTGEKSPLESVSGKNQAYERTDSVFTKNYTAVESDKEQTQVYRDAIAAAISDLENAFAGLTENNEAASDYKYRFIVLQGSTPGNVILGGTNPSEGQDTKNKIEDYYQWLKDHKEDEIHGESGLDNAAKYGEFTVTMCKTVPNRDLDSNKGEPLTWTLGFTCSNPKNAPRNTKVYVKPGSPHHNHNCPGTVCDEGSHPNCGTCGGTGQYLCTDCGGSEKKSCGDCGGTGTKDSGKCGTCNGTGEVPCAKYMYCGNCETCTHYYGTSVAIRHSGKSKYVDTWRGAASYTSTVNKGDFLTEAESYGDFTYGKMVGFHAKLSQTFHNVKYMDIVECKLFRLHKGMVKGLSNILCSNQVETLDEQQDILEMYCNTLGFQIYNTEQPNQKKWDKAYEDNGTTSKNPGVWRAVAANDLEEIDRIANSFNTETQIEYSKSPSGLSKHQFRPVNGYGDNLKFSYDILTQGGRSHHSIDGFIAQALATTFYRKPEMEASAVRNYIVVQSDYLAIEDGNKNLHPLACMDYDTSKLIPEPMLESDQPHSFTILTCKKPDIAKYYVNGTFFEIDKGNTQANSNSSQPKRGNVCAVHKTIGSMDNYMDQNDPVGQNSTQSHAYGETGAQYNVDFYLDSTVYTSGDMGSTYYEATKKKVNEDGGSTNWYTSFAHINVEPVTGDAPASVLGRVGYHGGTPTMRAGSFTAQPGNIGQNESSLVTENMYNSGTMEKCGHHFQDGIFYVNNMDGGDPDPGSYCSATFGAEMEKMGTVPVDDKVYFPFATSLNIGLYKPNKTYDPYATVLEYDMVTNYFYTLPKVASVDILTGYNGTPDFAEGFTHPIGDFNASAKAIGDVGEGQGLRTKAVSTNSVVVYNPSTAKTAILLTSDKLTDGKLNGDYGSSDQRVGTQWVTSGNETYISVGDMPDQTITIPTSYTYTLKEKSDVATTPYTLEDFDIDTTSDVTTSGVGAGGVFEATKTDSYDIVLYGNNSSSGEAMSNQMSIKMWKGDKLKNDGSTVTIERSRSKLPNITFETIKEAYEAYMDAQLKAKWDAEVHAEGETYTPYKVTTDYVPITKNTVLTFGLDNLPLRTGDVVKLTLDFDEVVQPEVTYSCSDTEAYEIHAIPEGTKWTWYLEAKNTNALGTLTLSFDKDATLKKFSDSCLNFDDVFVMNVDSVNKTTSVSGSYDWFYGHVTESSGKYYNAYVGSYISVAVKVNATVKANTLYVINTASKTNVGFKASALNNPHKVENANWKYHVLGWTTDKGVTITSPTMAILDEDTTMLVMPSKQTISVADVKSMGCLVKWGGKIYFTTTSDGLNHKITETGIQITGDDPHFDYIDVHTSYTDTLEFNSDNYPLLCKDSRKLYETKKCEFFIKCENSDAPVYDVSKATSLKYRYASNDITKISGVEAWTLDWDKVTKEEEKFITIGGKQYDKSSKVNATLDDSIQLYWDNSIPIPRDGNALDGITGTSNNLGAGWNNSFINRGLQDNEYQYRDFLEATGHENDTEATKWIAKKYVIFDRPVYAFICDGRVNPTAGPYGFGADGKCSKCGETSHGVAYIEAGTPVYLGYYGRHTSQNFESLGGDPGDDDSDNGGKFTDFGQPGTTCNEAHPYTYTFWLALGGGESSNAIVKCETINVNGMGEEHDNNNNADTNDSMRENSTDRYSNAIKDLSYTISGRIGALTIVESTDPRYSDTFKYADNTEDYLIYPLIRKIREYSNLEAVHGSQHRYLIDPFDIRGRIASADMLSVVQKNYRGTKDYSNYQIYGLGLYKTALVTENTKTWLTHVSEYNTYGTQWFKGEHDFDTNLGEYGDTAGDNSNSQAHKNAVIHNDSDGANHQLVERYAIPMSSSFNSHNELKLTPLRIGYELYCSLESIGNYYGESHMDLSADDDVQNNGGSKTTNAALDYNNRKVQIRPRYFWVPKDATEDYDGDPVPVDVYMNTTNGYVMINTGSDVPREYLRLLSSNRAISSLYLNTGKDETDLDQNMQRRLVTGSEAQITKNVLDYLNGDGKDSIAEGLDKTANWISILTPVKNTGNGNLGSVDLNPTYTYGNAQFLFLREKNRTFVGGSTAGLLSQDTSMASFQGNTSKNLNANKSLSWNIHAQKWYFGLGLPSSAKFVKSGKVFSEQNVLNAEDGYIIVTIDVVINGSIWTLQYRSDVARMNIEVGGKTVSWKYFNKEGDDATWNIPVTYYDLSDYTSSADLDTEGSH